MAKRSSPPLFCWGLLIVLALLLTSAQAISFGKAKEIGVGFPRDVLPSEIPDAYFSKRKSKLSTAYTTALDALEKLKSEPLCHKTAVALLISNCEILDGQNAATVLMDAGRAATDFIATSAASLAICDLERGGFEIPPACSKFRESTLAAIPLPTKPSLHVTKAEIDGCLDGLAKDHSTWNTWLSYRDKATSFCKAARAANEKDHSIQVNQRMTQIISNLTSYLEEELGGLYQSLNVKFRDIFLAIGDLAPQLHDVHRGLLDIGDVVKDLLLPNTQRAADSIHYAEEKAAALDQFMATLLDKAHETGSKLQEKHEIALQTSADQATREFAAVMDALAAALISSSSLQHELVSDLHINHLLFETYKTKEQSQAQAAAISLRQESLASDLATIEELTLSLRMQQENHSETLDRAQQSAVQLLESVQSVSQAWQDLLGFHFGWMWPSLYVICPFLSLTAGNWKRTSPTKKENLLLVCLGLLLAQIIIWWASCSEGGMIIIDSENMVHNTSVTYFKRPFLG